MIMSINTVLYMKNIIMLEDSNDYAHNKNHFKLSEMHRECHLW